ncbi:MAG: hypothetical protein QXL96_08320 [Ignisphaera sp.]
MMRHKFKYAQSSFIAYLIAVVLIVVILFSVYYVITDISKPSVKTLDFVQIAKNQINGGSVYIFFNSTPPSKAQNITILVISGNGNFTLRCVYAVYGGSFINITKYVYAAKITPNSRVIIGPLPKPITYNFTSFSIIKIGNMNIPIWNTTLVLQINAYNQTIFATMYPNSTAFS